MIDYDPLTRVVLLLKNLSWCCAGTTIHVPAHMSILVLPFAVTQWKSIQPLSECSPLRHELIHVFLEPVVMVAF